MQKYIKWCLSLKLSLKPFNGMVIMDQNKDGIEYWARLLKVMWFCQDQYED